MASKEKAQKSIVMDFGLWAKAHGWALGAVTSPEIAERDQKAFLDWLQSSKGPQMKYLENRQSERLNPKQYFPEVRSILVFAYPYFKGWAKGPIKVSSYAWDEDYHNVLKEKLESSILSLKNDVGDFSYRLAVDTAPVLEKSIAAKSGLGWQGKNSLIIHPKWGSQFFLAEVLTSIPLEKFSAQIPMTDHCGQCTRCIDACPTDALEPYWLDAQKCISYWNLEHKGDFSEQTPKFEKWIAGCDICQEVCPWNQKLIPLEDQAHDFQTLTAEDIQSIDWLKRISNKAINYVPPENWKRNLEHIQKK